jgi:hypothetical protein
MKSMPLVPPATNTTTIWCYTTWFRELTEWRELTLMKMKKMWIIIWIMTPAMRMRERQQGINFTN